MDKEDYTALWILGQGLGEADSLVLYLSWNMYKHHSLDKVSPVAQVGLTLQGILCLCLSGVVAADITGLRHQTQIAQFRSSQGQAVHAQCTAFVLSFKKQMISLCRLG